MTASSRSVMSLLSFAFKQNGTGTGTGTSTKHRRAHLHAMVLNARCLVAYSFLLLSSHRVAAATGGAWTRFNSMGGSDALYTIHRELEFGDFTEDVPEECPATTTCPSVCVANETDCPFLCDDNKTLCSTGHCALDCSVYDSAPYTNPCSCPDLPVACPKTVSLYPLCYERFGDYYANNTACIDAQVETVPKLSFVGTWFLVCYVAFGAIFYLVVGWCLFNQILCPIATSTVPLVAAQRGTNSTAWTQTGYRTTWLGILIYGLVELSFVAVQFLLLITTLFYYMQQGAITRWAPVFEDEIQVLQAFQMVWMVGFVWCFSFRYPVTGVYSLFLRRCDLSEATHVAVVAPLTSADGREDSSRTRHVLSMVWTPVDRIFRVLFSYPYGQPGMETEFCPIGVDERTGTRHISFRLRRYVYKGSTQCYVAAVMSVGLTFDDLVRQIGGLSQDEAEERRGMQGPNVIPLSKPTIIGSLYKEFSKSFYLYQTFSIWSFANFYFYFMAIVNLFVRTAAALIVTYFQHTSDCLLYQLARVEGTVEVLRDGACVEIPVEDVVPADVVVLKPGTVHCDLIVLKGYRILVDESALTGESTPVLKAEFDRSMRYQTYFPSHHKLCTISAGTEILEVDDNEQALGLVTASGSFTTKGELLTDVLSYRRHKFQFDDEVKMVVCILAVEALFMISLVFYFLDDDWVYSWFYGAYVLATCLPPLLPTVYVTAICISAKRLQDKRISCPYPESILTAGRVNAALFDKTGTLTKQGLDYISCESNGSEDRIRMGMAVCHTLTTTSTGQVVGNHVDLASFQSTGATIMHTKGGPNRISYRDKNYVILKQFEFDCNTATQSVIVEDEHGNRQIYVKGSADVIKALCMSSSLPNTFDKSTHVAAKSGIYQIAMAYRTYNLDMPMEDVRRDDVERLLTFAGFINCRNTIRDEAYGVIHEIEESGMTIAMITGDHALNGVYIAREAGMIKRNQTVILGRTLADSSLEWIDTNSDAIVAMPSPEALTEKEVVLAVSGDAWHKLCKHDADYASSILRHVRVFGRCKPKDKVTVVDMFVAQGYTTLMCGDGQNDCGCLKAAHIGVALSNAEASIVAPFTSIDKTLTSVLEVLREGRCALASALSSYSYYIIYGQTETYLQVIMAYLSVTFSEWCWVFLDGIWSISLAFSIPLSQSKNTLQARRPADSLLGMETLFGVGGILAWNFFFVVLALAILFRQDWFLCRKWNSDDVSSAIIIGDNYESSVLFIIGGYQYICSAIVLNFGYTFRQAWYRNFLFVLLSMTWTLFFFVMTIYPSTFSCIWRVNCTNDNVVRFVTSGDPFPINNPFHTTVMPLHFRWILVFLMAINFLTISLWQRRFVNGYLQQRNAQTTKGRRLDQPVVVEEQAGRTALGSKSLLSL